MDLTDRKIDLTLRLYIDPADQDYLAARSAFNNCLFHVFYWCAAQACEKYLKAAILLQDRSAQDYGHDLASLFRDVRQFDRQGVIPEHLDLPETSAIGRSAWQGKPSALYVDYLAKYGSPDNRYAFHGTHVNGPVLHALDILCCAFRRLMRATNLTGGDLFAHQSPRLSHYQQIGNDQGWMIDPSLLLESLFVKVSGWTRSTFAGHVFQYEFRLLPNPR